MSSNQIIFSLVFVAAGIALVRMNNALATYMTEQWLNVSEWFIPVKIRQNRAYTIYKGANCKTLAV
jgi:hypothetical protein